MNQDKRYIDLLDLQNDLQIALDQIGGWESMDKADWQTQEGVVITGNQAYLILNLLKQAKRDKIRTALSFWYSLSNIGERHLLIESAIQDPDKVAFLKPIFESVNYDIDSFLKLVTMDVKIQLINYINNHYQAFDPMVVDMEIDEAGVL